MANIDLTISINSDHVDRIVDCLNEYADKDITLVVARNQPVSDVWQFQYDSKGSETTKEWGQNILKKLFLELVRCYEYNLDRERLETEIQELTPASHDVPEEAINV